MTTITVLLFGILCSLIFIASELRWISKGLALLLEQMGLQKRGLLDGITEEQIRQK